MILILIAIVLGLVGGILGWSYWIVITIVAVLAILNIAYFLYIILFCQNIHSIEKLLRRNRKNPMYGYLLAIKDENIPEANTHLKHLTEKYKKTESAKSYAYILAYLNNNLDEAREYAHQLKNPVMRSYSIAMVDAYEGNGAQHLHTDFKKPWMNEAIKATHYYAIGDMELFTKHRALTLSHSKGIQFASNLYALDLYDKQKNGNFHHNPIGTN